MIFSIKSGGVHTQTAGFDEGTKTESPENPSVSGCSALAVPPPTPRKPSTKDGQEHLEWRPWCAAASETTGLTARQKNSEVVMREQNSSSPHGVTASSSGLACFAVRKCRRHYCMHNPLLRSTYVCCDWERICSVLPHCIKAISLTGPAAIACI